ncbi:MAG: 50S ribosomal protein L21 [Candidatus Kerfeldbacteria bacterium]|nr:50S ribosomal protein L21 [Candidatus Kerfeldbacteria bacterium]
MFAIIRTGGKQYLVEAGHTITIETLPVEAGKPVTFNEVLLINDQDLKVGSPLVKDAKVEGTVVSHGRHPKVVGIKFHNKVRYRRKFGHRQHFTRVKIEKISA